jgi:hypothetical protein
MLCEPEKAAEWISFLASLRGSKIDPNAMERERERITANPRPERCEKA